MHQENVKSSDSNPEAPCKEFKVSYDECFRQWFQDEFLKGDFTDRCKGHLQLYRACLIVSLSIDLGM
ncbi:Mitochondrial distribution-morphology family 35-apoptosis [Babesia duncani]|uniref:Mitochondrial distribution-morphology family 35-apoptosis n=1 Tax=Babesia duncani TaxID=323732 RepID=A0AAD9UN42_9APIC|nr:Mitochondrial distribution-morphology family 35-apoptosis [Babesia duncani]